MLSLWRVSIPNSKSLFFELLHNYASFPGGTEQDKGELDSSSPNFLVDQRRQNRNTRPIYVIIQMTNSENQKRKITQKYTPSAKSTSWPPRQRLSPAAWVIMQARKEFTMYTISQKASKQRKKTRDIPDKWLTIATTSGEWHTLFISGMSVNLFKGYPTFLRYSGLECSVSHVNVRLHCRL
jgi:hypothetical protein